MNKKYLKIFATVFCLCFLLLSLSGCIDYSVDAKINATGGGSVTVEAVMEEEVFEMIEEEGFDYRELDGVKKSTFKEDGISYVKLYKKERYSSMKAFREGMQDLTVFSDIDEECRVFRDFDYGMEGKGMFVWGEVFSQGDSATMTVTIEMPAEIIDWRGAYVDGKVAVIEVGDENEEFYIETASVTGAAVWRIVLIVLAALFAAAAVTVLVIFLVRKTRAARAMAAVEAKDTEGDETPLSNQAEE